MPMMGSWLPFSSKSRYAGSSTMPRKFKYTDLEKATLNFHVSNRIGNRCYKGTIFMKLGYDTHSRRMDVVIKNLTGVQARKRSEWVREIIVLEDVDHPNLAKVLGYCAEGSKRCKFEFGRYYLVTEFLKNGSVRDHLSKHTLHGLISWKIRLRIARDAARALSYLHGKNIVHKMFSSSVVLLDEKFNVKVCDYLMSRLGPIDERGDNFDLHDFSAFGPSMFMEQYCGSRSETDIWSFGVFLCELITGTDPAQKVDNLERSNREYTKFVEQNFASEERVKAIVDPRLRGEYNLESAQELVNIAKMCLRNEPDFRPSMKTVASMLSGIV